MFGHDPEPTKKMEKKSLPESALPIQVGPQTSLQTGAQGWRDDRESPKRRQKRRVGEAGDGVLEVGRYGGDGAEARQLEGQRVQQVARGCGWEHGRVESLADEGVTKGREVQANLVSPPSGWAAQHKSGAAIGGDRERLESGERGFRVAKVWRERRDRREGPRRAGLVPAANRQVHLEAPAWRRSVAERDVGLPARLQRGCEWLHGRATEREEVRPRGVLVELVHGPDWSAELRPERVLDRPRRVGGGPGRGHAGWLRDDDRAQVLVKDREL